jgi:hypothetical protein
VRLGSTARDISLYGLPAPSPANRVTERFNPDTATLAGEGAGGPCKR